MHLEFEGKTTMIVGGKVACVTHAVFATKIEKKIELKVVYFCKKTVTQNDHFMAQSNSAHKVGSTHLRILKHVFVERVTCTLSLDIKLGANES